MRCVFFLCFLWIFLSCQEKAGSFGDWREGPLYEGIYQDLSDSQDYISEIRDELCRYVAYVYPDSVCLEDPVLWRRDPHAYRLLMVMMRQEEVVHTPYECWAWMLNVDSLIEKYNRRLGRETGSSDLAMGAIEEMVADYSVGTQSEMNMASAVFSIVETYKTVKAYSRYIEIVDDYDIDPGNYIKLSDLCYHEFCAWFELMNLSKRIMLDYTFAWASYSSLPMDICYTIKGWMTSRHDFLDKELELLWSDELPLYLGGSKRIKPKAFSELLDCYRVREGAQDGEDDNVEETDEIDRVAMYAMDYETALEAWREHRERIAGRLPIGLRSSYRAFTNDLHTSFYATMLSLRDREY